MMNWTGRLLQWFFSKPTANNAEYNKKDRVEPTFEMQAVEEVAIGQIVKIGNAMWRRDNHAMTFVCMLPEDEKVRSVKDLPAVGYVGLSYEIEGKLWSWDGAAWVVNDPDNVHESIAMEMKRARVAHELRTSVQLRPTRSVAPRLSDYPTRRVNATETRTGDHPPGFFDPGNIAAGVMMMQALDTPDPTPSRHHHVDDTSHTHHDTTPHSSPSHDSDYGSSDFGGGGFD